MRGRLSLARALSKFGVCSRRQAERLIAEGRVRVGGSPVSWPSRRIDPRRDVVTVDGRRVKDVTDTLVIALHKPAGYITTRSEPAGRKTVYELLEGVAQWVFPVGRLDKDTSGLLILTNDHRLGERLTSPEAHVPKTYNARVRGLPELSALEVLREGVRLEDGSLTRRARVRLLGSPRSADSSWLEIVLTEGKNRQVRRMCAAVGHDVLELVRVRIGGFALAELAPGEWRQLTPEQVAELSAASGRS